MALRYPHLCEPRGLSLPAGIGSPGSIHTVVTMSLCVLFDVLADTCGNVRSAGVGYAPRTAGDLVTAARGLNGLVPIPQRKRT
jgi:hypothetical protein